MSKILSYFIIALLTFGFTLHEASAKRFGGGRSFGVQRSHNSLFSSQKTQKTAPLSQKANTSKWGGMLGGLLVGGLLASLFMGHGLGTGLLSWLILGAALFFIVSFMKKRMQPGFQSSQGNAFRQTSFNPSNSSFTNWGASTSHTSKTPEFDEEEFLRHAKVTFIRLQSAYDNKNLQDLSTFTAPEVFAEIKMQLDERGDAPNKTEVLRVEAELLDVSKQSFSTIASVRFTGTIKENNDAPVQLDEIWHFRQFDDNKNWVVGGIQQEVYEP